MKTRFLACIPVLILIAFLCLQVSTVLASQAIYGNQGRDGRPTDWDSPIHNAYVSPQAARVQQGIDGAGGGEGKPTDWDSPKKFSQLSPMPYEVRTMLSLPVLKRLFGSLSAILPWWMYR